MQRWFASSSDPNGGEVVDESIPPEAYLRLVREVASRHALEWLTDDENAELVRAVRMAMHDAPDGQAGLAMVAEVLRFSAVQAVTPEGGFATPLGPRLGLLCRFIETAIAVVDWDWVAREVTSFHTEGGT